MKIIYDPSCINYSSPGHPESPDRMIHASEYLQHKYEFESPQAASKEALLKTHSEAHIESLINLSFSDPDCPRYENIFEHAALSAGAAIAAARENGFAMMRPPGHHATRDNVSGFCYLNNVAIAIKRLGQRTLIIDFDGHHGDGTEAIFLGDSQVEFISLHSSPNYPGTGLTSQQNCHNVPLPFHCGDGVYLNAFDRVLEEVNLSDVEQIAVSAGFDAFELDPLASLGLTRECFGDIGARIAQLKLPTFSVLEGGYDTENLGPNIDSYLKGLQLQAGIPGS